MAHADHIGITGSGPGDHINNGALDNAAGIATLLRLDERSRRARTPAAIDPARGEHR